MNFFTIKSYQSEKSYQSDSGGILSPQEIEHETNKISKSIQSEIERQFNQFEKRIVIYDHAPAELHKNHHSDLESKDSES